MRWICHPAADLADEETFTRGIKDIEALTAVCCQQESQRRGRPIGQNKASNKKSRKSLQTIWKKILWTYFSCSASQCSFCAVFGVSQSLVFNPNFTANPPSGHRSTWQIQYKVTAVNRIDSSSSVTVGADVGYDVPDSLVVALQGQRVLFIIMAVTALPEEKTKPPSLAMCHGSCPTNRAPTVRTSS